ncbi:MAG: Nif11-like leader peptide family natural product precursor [Oscillospiraceae bacterium]|jgi:hypothetical protein|nr:Nif11-like leader peptide family natural product precursor [Oscillospiraceae bacterium]
MSKENVKKFYEALAKEEKLRKKLKDLNLNISGGVSFSEKEQLFQDELIPFAKNAGYEFTLDELKNVEKEMSNFSSKRLNDSDLQIAGGFVGACIAIGRGFDIEKKLAGEYLSPGKPYVRNSDQSESQMAIGAILLCLAVGFGIGSTKDKKGNTPTACFVLGV